jgi:hypothetical protein
VETGGCEIGSGSVRRGRQGLVDLPAIDQIHREQPGGQHPDRQRRADDRQARSDGEAPPHATVSRAIR